MSRSGRRPLPGSLAEGAYSQGTRNLAWPGDAH